MTDAPADARPDARFEDAAPGALRLMALDAEDLDVLSALVQDAVVQVAEVSWARKARRLALLVNRPRREERTARPERVRSLLVVENATAVRAQGVDPQDRDTVLSILAMTFAGDTDGPGTLTLTLAGDGLVEVAVEALEVLLQDVTRPYRAVSGRLPQHPED